MTQDAKGALSGPDILERLRTNAEWAYERMAYSGVINGDEPPTAAITALEDCINHMREAADEIERLRAELDRYEGGVRAVYNGLTTPDLFILEAGEELGLGR